MCVMEENNGFTEKKTLTFPNQKKKISRRFDRSEYRIMS